MDGTVCAGEALTPLVSQLIVDPSGMPKVVAMLLEMKDEDVFHLLEDPDYLQFKVTQHLQLSSAV
jgi:hypothetical protein